jgi:hypothetical protein
MTHAEIAAALGVAEGTVASRRSRALETRGVIAHDLEREGFFRELDPPPGGVARFAERLDVSSAPRLWLRPAPLALAGTAFAAIVAIAVLVWPTAR